MTPRHELVQDELDRLWSDARHWERFGVYRCAADRRLLVPQRGGKGWTVNMGHPRAQATLWGFVVLVSGVVVALIVFVTRAA
jgi:uncharacterized membrane protein